MYLIKLQCWEVEDESLSLELFQTQDIQSDLILLSFCCEPSQNRSWRDSAHFMATEGLVHSSPLASVVTWKGAVGAREQQHCVTGEQTAGKWW